MSQGTIVAVCTSQAKGTPKVDRGQGILIEGCGLADDAHAEPAGARQVSLLAEEAISGASTADFPLSPGDFAENLTVRGIALAGLPVGTKLEVGQEAILEITQIGKDCTTPCSVYYRTGNCIMPREGVFCRVLRGGPVRAGDAVRISRQ